jgi:hypothetical protein
MITWKLRVAGALLLASLFQMSDGSALWTDLLPTLLVAFAAAVMLVQVVRRYA